MKGVVIMSETFIEIAKACAKNEIKKQPIGQFINAKIVSVREDFLRATVRFETGQIVENMLNKSSEKLTEGQSVKVEFITTPSNGWIALTNGEADPLGGGGTGVQVGSAAILTTSTVEDFTVNREVMIDYSPATKVVYGAVPSFCLINGVYCLIGSFNANTVQTILDHRQYFGDSFSMPFYSYYSSTDHSYTGKVYSYLDSINTSGNWTAYSRFEDDYGRNSLSNVSFYNRPSVTEWFILPIIPTFVSVANMSTPSMSTTKRDALLAAGITMIPQYMNVGIIYKEAGVWKYDTNYRVSTLLYRGSSGYYAYPMWTRDEMDFALSVSQRVEPVTPTP